MPEWIIQTKDLTKKYGTFTAVDHLNLRLHPGEVFGLLGPNGAGKTTTILMLLGLTEPTSGKVAVLDMDPARNPLAVKARVGYLPDEVGFYENLSAWENLMYIARLNGLPRKEAYTRIEEALERVHLQESASKLVSTFSRGMRQRLGVADVLIKKPSLIILDEPTNGLDPEGAREFLHMITALKEEGITILLSSHLLYQVQAVCDRVGLFYHGRMVLEGTVPDLARRVLGGAYRIQIEATAPDGVLTTALQALPGIVNLRQMDGHTYELETKKDLRPQAAAAVVEAGGQLLSLAVESQSLDAIYARYFEEVERAKHG
jgi:ABC-2 type transport system ATP-binding protein